MALRLVLLLVVASAAALWALGESEWPMLVIGLGGLLAGKALGLPDRPLAVIGLGIMLVTWPLALFTLPVPGLASTLAHFVVAALVAWMIADPVRDRWRWARARLPAASWFAIPALVLAIGGVWELGEWAGDALLGTDLAVDATDTILDLVVDLAGAISGLALHDRLRPERPDHAKPSAQRA